MSAGVFVLVYGWVFACGSRGEGEKGGVRAGGWGG